MIEQINIALEQKRIRFLSLVIEAAVGGIERRHIHQLKVMKNEHHVLHSVGTILSFTLITRNIAVIGSPVLPYSDRLRVGSI